MKEEIYKECVNCGNPVYEYMTGNKDIIDKTGLCAVCATGESSLYTDELNN